MSGIALDRLRTGGALQAALLEDFVVGEAPIRDPHRHDYHELIWVREGTGRHLIDGVAVPVRPYTLTLIGRGAVHVFQAARVGRGGLLRFAPELVADGRLAPGWLLAGRGGRTVTVPRGEADALEAAFAALAAEAARPSDGFSADLERHLVSVVLLWTERWYDAQRTERRAGDDSDVELFRRFSAQLERDFRSHHDAAHYADALAVPPAALARALNEVTGRSTKELVTDRVMLEASRLLRFTDATVGEVAHAAGFTDPLYFSRAFKRHAGAAPMAYRDAVRGRG